MDNKAWTTLDETWIKAVSEVPDMSRRGVEIAEVGGIHGRGEQHTVMQWHYAVGYVYYSARGGFYDAERAAAIALDADYTTLSGCDFISSQDTFCVHTRRVGAQLGRGQVSIKGIGS